MASLNIFIKFKIYIFNIKNKKKCYTVIETQGFINYIFYKINVILIITEVPII